MTDFKEACNVCGKKFILYLYEYNHLDDLTITKELTEELYKCFIEENNIIDISFDQMLNCTSNWIKTSKDDSQKLIFVKQQSLQLRSSQKELDVKFKAINGDLEREENFASNSGIREEVDIVSEENCTSSDITFEKSKESLKKPFSNTSSTSSRFDQFSRNIDTSEEGNLVSEEVKLKSEECQKFVTDTKVALLDNYSSIENQICGSKLENRKALQTQLTEPEDASLREFNEAVNNIPKYIGDQPLAFRVDDCLNLDRLILRKSVPKEFGLHVINNLNREITILSIQTKKPISEVTLAARTPFKLVYLSTIIWRIKAQTHEDGIISFPILFEVQDRYEVKYQLLDLVFYTHDYLFDKVHALAPFKEKTKPIIPSHIAYRYIDHGRPTRSGISLKQYLIPADLFAVLKNSLKPFPGMSQQEKTRLASIQKLLNSKNNKTSITEENYIQLLTIQLYAEEVQILKNISEYNQTGETLRRVGKYLLELQVPNLAEHRPSVRINDLIHIRENQSGKVYDGKVSRIDESSIRIRFPRHAIDAILARDETFHVSFFFDRYCFRVQHQAIAFTMSDDLMHIFFPKEIPRSDLPHMELEWFNKAITNNPEQQQAIRAVLAKSAMPAPYLIFGPPGTGKTMTVVECVLQIYKNTKDNVLICAPSNSAANEITKRLIGTVSQKDLLRYVARSFWDQMPEDLMQYSNCNKSQFFELPKFDSFRIIICTLISAAKLVDKIYLQNYFSYVFIDEAGQATESETLVPIARIVSNENKKGNIFGQIVLAGDPRQLGPIVHSKLATRFGFGISMLERLIDNCPPYKRNSVDYNPCALTKLVNNYRSHSTIINFLNKVFYDNDLQVKGGDVIHSGINWKELPNKDFPILFHSVIGTDQREKGSPSYFNIQEIQIVIDYLDKLMGSEMNGIKITADDLMIVSPYKKQVEKLKQLCSPKGYPDLLIGSAEQVQGQERLIVIVTTVRSKPQLLNFDAKFNLGFLDNPKRFNVAITRAKALLIIVGNPNILQFDKHWKSLIEYCKNNNSITGCEFEFCAENVQTTLNETDLGEGTSVSESTP